jgi:hypothetical protein
MLCLFKIARAVGGADSMAASTSARSTIAKNRSASLPEYQRIWRREADRQI